MKRTRLHVLTLVLFACILAACSADDPVDDAGNDSNQASESVIINGVNDEIKLDAPAERVVALEWTYAEDLLAVGVQPVGVADIDGYQSWVNIETELSEDVADVGTRQEPNLEAIAALEPDLIIGIQFRHEGLLQELESIAPTVLFDPYPTDESVNQYDEMEATFKEIAKAVNKEQEADDVLASLSDTYEAAKAEIEASSLSTTDFVLTQAFTGAQAPEIRVFTPNAMASVIFEKIGLTNVFEPSQFEMYGYSTVNVEALTSVEDANYFYVVQDDDNIYENQLKDNPVWNDLNFVKENRMFSLGGDAWLFGGPLSAETLVDRVTSSIVE